MANPVVKRREVIVAHNAAVATDDERCSKIALNVLNGVRPWFPKPGNAVDAAVAAALSLGVVSLASSGIGGGAFVVLRLANGKTEAFDMRETAPLRASKDMFGGNELLKFKGPLAVGVPGELAGLHKIWKEYGTLPWDCLVKPAEELARGFKISDYLYWEMCLMESAIRADKGLSEMLIKNGKLLQKGDICQNTKLAETLKKISEEGVEAFYNGEIGENLTKDILELGGIVTVKDLQTYTVKKRKPIVTNTLGLELIGMPPPSAGGAGIVLMLNILAQYGVPLDISGDIGIQRKIEALKHVFAIRLNIGDPDFVDCSAVISDMLSVEFAKKLKETIDDNKTFGPCHYGGGWNELYQIPMREHGTSHFSIMDHYGNAIALTSTLNNHFGAQILSPRTGIVLNNQMDDFSIPFPRVCPNNMHIPANFISPGKRPLSSMSPTIILKNGRLNAVVGGSGGILIIPAVSEVILNYYAKKMDELSCVMNPRSYPRMVPNEVHYENFTTVTDDHIEVPVETRKVLMEKGHILKKLDSGAVCQFITLKELLKGNIITKEIVAVSDPRKGGVPAGF